jgi:hypothetical protein
VCSYCIYFQTWFDFVTTQNFVLKTTFAMADSVDLTLLSIARHVRWWFESNLRRPYHCSSCRNVLKSCRMTERILVAGVLNRTAICEYSMDCQKHMCVVNKIAKRRCMLSGICFVSFTTVGPLVVGVGTEFYLL